MSFKDYYHPTPVRLRKIGDLFLIVSASLSSAVLGAPFTEHSKLWIIFCLNIIGLLGKLITNFYKEDPKEIKPGQEN